jgi:cysteinyl-tRNA synthetase
MALRIYNTLSRTKEEFTTIEPGKVRMYVCGPTVYADAHLGHAMSALVFDIARRYLEYKGYDVRYVMNFTDVDDKIINKANDLGVDAFCSPSSTSTAISAIWKPSTSNLPR